MAHFQAKAPKTLNEYLTSAKNFANWLTAHDRIKANPLKSVCKVESRGRQVRVRRAFTDEEMVALLLVAGAQRIVYQTATTRPEFVTAS